MLNEIKNKFKILVERFGQAWTSCMLMMVEGDVTAFTLHHAKTASKTGIATGLAMVAATFIPWKEVRENKWFSIFLVGVFTTSTDLLNHGTHFGSWWTEGVVTGFGAMLLAVAYERMFKKEINV